MSQGFHQIEVHQGSRDYTTFVTQYGRYMYRRMPFGLKNAPAVSAINGQGVEQL